MGMNTNITFYFNHWQMVFTIRGVMVKQTRQSIHIVISSRSSHHVVGREKLLIGSAVSRTHSLLITHRYKHKSSSLTS